MLQPSRPLSVATKKSIAIVLIGNFLDFFDLLLATYLAVVLAKVFLPAESELAPFIAAFVFCSGFCIRPIAAVFWGYIGDSIGRVPVLISTTFLISLTCLLIPNIPSYEEWGIASAILFLGLRLLQGFAAGGECIAADVFVVETVHDSNVYFWSSLVEATCSLGGVVACGVGVLCLSLSPEEGWKLPFYIGSGVAVLGAFARRTLKETPDFLKVRQERGENSRKIKIKEFYASLDYRNRNISALLAMYAFPSCAFYFSLAYIPFLLASKFGMSPTAVMVQAMIVLFVTMCAEILYGFLGLYIRPFKILRFKLVCLLCILPVFALSTDNFLNYKIITAIQIIVLCLGQGLTPAIPIIVKSFPVVGRYTHILLIWAFSHSLMYFFTGYVCAQIVSFSVLCMTLFSVAVISLVGTNMFVPKYKIKADNGKLSNLNGADKINQMSAKKHEA